VRYVPWLARPALPDHTEAVVKDYVGACKARGTEMSSCPGSPESPYFETAPYLEEVVTWMAEESCGENFKEISATTRDACLGVQVGSSVYPAIYEVLKSDLRTCHEYTS
jgi:hypothetical protein